MPRKKGTSSDRSSSGSNVSPTPKSPSNISGSIPEIQRGIANLHVGVGYDFPIPQIGKLGKKIMIKANHFQVDLPRGSVFHYDVDIRNSKSTEGLPDGSIVGAEKPKGIPKKMNPRLTRRIVDLMIKKYMFDSNHAYWPAYDGNRNMYTRHRLPIQKMATFKVTIMATPGVAATTEDFLVTIKPAEKADSGDCEVSLEPLHELMEGRTNMYPEETITALDIILRHGPALKFVPVGNSFFMKPKTNEEIPLEEGRAVWFGYHQSLRPGWKPLPESQRTIFHLNIDKSTTAFLRPLNLVDFCFEVLHLGNRKPPPTLTDSNISVLNKNVKGIRIKALHLSYPRKYRINRIMKQSASKLTFVWNDETVTVQNYFLRMYKRKLLYPNYPCVHVGNPSKDVYLPMEVLEVEDEQSSRGKLTKEQSATMIRVTAISPENRFREIADYIKLAIENNREVIKEFEIQINPYPVQIQARVLTPPAICYQNGNVSVRDGKWQTKGKKLFVAQKIEIWVVLTICQVDNAQVTGFINSIREVAREVGMDVANPAQYITRPVTLGGFRTIFQELCQQHKNLQMVMVILPKNSGPIYREIKAEGETFVGLMTQCVAIENVVKCSSYKFYYQYCSNVCLKMNAKLDGINTCLQKADKPVIFRAPIMLVGADVSHPGPGAEGYSVAACVGSMDGYPARYVCKVRLQRLRGEFRTREERILQLNLMIKELLQEFYRQTGGKKPHRIVFFRDGVSEGQFAAVKEYELRLIRQACLSLENDYNPGVTYLVVQRRHHTRFAPLNPHDGSQWPNGNVPAGTVVDTAVAHPSFFNFFLATHVALQGTSRPAHYTVLWDENGFTADTLQQFIFYLCHTYNRCSRSVSSPPPVMYADLAAYRAKLYIDAMLDRAGTDSNDGSVLDEIRDDALNAIVTKDVIKNKMYFV